MKIITGIIIIVWSFVGVILFYGNGGYEFANTIKQYKKRILFISLFGPIIIAIKIFDYWCALITAAENLLAIFNKRLNDKYLRNIKQWFRE